MIKSFVFLSNLPQKRLLVQMTYCWKTFLTLQQTHMRCWGMVIIQRLMDAEQVTPKYTQMVLYLTAQSAIYHSLIQNIIDKSLSTHDRVERRHMALLGMNFDDKPIKSVEVDTTSSANGNLPLPLFYNEGVPVACKLKDNGGTNVYAILGRYANNDTGNWGAKIIKEANTNGQVTPVPNTRIVGTLYYLEL